MGLLPPLSEGAWAYVHPPTHSRQSAMKGDTAQCGVLIGKYNDPTSACEVSADPGEGVYFGKPEGSC